MPVFAHRFQHSRFLTGLVSAAGTTALALLGLAVAGQRAHADSLTLGTDYHPFYITTSPAYEGLNHALEGGGDAEATLNGELLAGTYCVDLLDPVYLGGSYPTTTVSTDGTIFGHGVNNAGAISWLMTQYAAGATTADQQNALQAAIWRTEYGSDFELDGADNAMTGNSATLIDTYHSYLSSLGNNTESLNNVVWISPDDNTARNYNYQGLVGIRTGNTASAVPEAGSLALVLPALLPVIGLIARRRRIA